MKKSLSPAIKFLKSVHIGFILIVMVILAAIVVRLALPGIVKNYINKKLNELPGYTGHVGDIDIHLLRGAYVMAATGFDINKRQPVELLFKANYE